MFVLYFLFSRSDFNENKVKGVKVLKYIIYVNFVVITIALFLGIVNGWLRMFGYRGLDDDNNEKVGDRKSTKPETMNYGKCQEKNEKKN